MSPKKRAESERLINSIKRLSELGPQSLLACSDIAISVARVARKGVTLGERRNALIRRRLSYPIRSLEIEKSYDSKTVIKYH